MKYIPVRGSYRNKGYLRKIGKQKLTIRKIVKCGKGIYSAVQNYNTLEEIPTDMRNFVCGDTKEKLKIALRYVPVSYPVKIGINVLRRTL